MNTALRKEVVRVQDGVKDLSPFHRGLNVYLFTCSKHGVFASRITFQFPNELDVGRSTVCLMSDCSETACYFGFQKA